MNIPRTCRILAQCIYGAALLAQAAFVSVILLTRYLDGVALVPGNLSGWRVACGLIGGLALLGLGDWLAARMGHTFGLRIEAMWYAAAKLMAERIEAQGPK